MSKDSSLDYMTVFVVAVAVDGATVIVVWIVQRVRMTYVHVYVYVLRMMVIKCFYYESCSN